MAPESIVTTMTLRRLDPLELSGPLVIRLPRPWPFYRAAKVVSWQERSKQGTKVEFCSVNAELVYERTRLDRGERFLSPGTLRVEDRPKARSEGTLKLVFEGFERTGEFASALLLKALMLGREPTRIPLIIEVTNNFWMPLAIITLGVMAAFGISRLAKRWRPLQETRLRVLRMSAQVYRLRHVVDNPADFIELAALVGRLAPLVRRANRTTGSEELDDVEKQVAALKTQHQHKHRRCKETARSRRGVRGRAFRGARGYTSRTAVYPNHAMSTLEKDLPVMVDALLGGPYPEFGGVRLDAVLSFSAINHKDANAAAEQALRRQVIGARDSRVLAAAARLAFEHEPRNYADGDAQGRLIERVKKAQSGGVRGKPKWRNAQETRRLEAADRETAQRLHALLADGQDDETLDNRAGS